MNKTKRILMAEQIERAVNDKLAKKEITELEKQKGAKNDN